MDWFEKEQEANKRHSEEFAKKEAATLDDILAVLKEPKTTEKVEVTNFPKERELVVPAPIVNVPAPIVNLQSPKVEVAAPNVTVDNTQVAIEVAKLGTPLEKILIEVTREDGKIEKVQLVDEKGKPVNFSPIVNVHPREGYGGGGTTGGGLTRGELIGVINSTSIAPLSGTTANGTRDLTSANTWYAVPSTVPASPYILVATIENSVGTVRFGFDNTGTPSATNGNQAPSQLTIRLAANQVIYYASSTAGDDVNWTTKII